MIRRRWVAIVGAGVALLTLTTPLHAQEAPVESTLPEHSTDERMVRIAADRIARAALLFLRQLTDPTAEDYRVVALTLSQAAELLPNDAELQRLLLEAWFAAGDEAKVMEATRRLIRLDPSDTVAQLRLISDRVSKYQSVEERQQAYDRLLQEGAGALDASIRSRLALDDAMLARELGDQDRFVERLTLATQLDSTNKAAAILATTYALARLENPVDRVEMLANVVLADPFDPATHDRLAEELFSRGAFKSADRFFQHSFLLRRMSGMTPSPDLNMRVMLTNWAVHGSQHFVDIMLEGERTERFSIQKRREAAALAGEDPNQIPPYSPSPLNESLRLAAAVALGDEFETRAALERFNRLTQSMIEHISQSGAPGPDGQPGLTAEQIKAGVREWRANLLWQRLLAGLELDAAEEDIEFLAGEAESGAIRPEAIQRFRGLLAAQRGERDRAHELLSPLSSTDPRAQAGLGLAEERAGDDRAAMRYYAELALKEPGSLLGVWARARIETLLGQPLEPTSTVRAIEAYCASLPPEIDRLITEPRSILHLEASQTSETIQPFDRLEVRVRVRNVSPIPLAIGPGAPISSDVLLSPRLTVGSNQILEQIKPEVVSLERRLRLMPGESLEATIWAGQGQTGDINDRSLLNSTLIRWRVVQGFGVTKSGEFAPTPLSLTAETQIARRPPLSPPAGGIGRVPELIRNASGAELVGAMIMAPAAVQVAAQRGNIDIGRQLLEQVIAALLDRLPTMDRYERVLATQLLPTAKAAAEFQPIDDILRNDPDPLVRTMYLYARAVTPEDEVFSMVQESGDPALMQVAARLQERLRRRASTAATEPAK